MTCGTPSGITRVNNPGWRADFRSEVRSTIERIKQFPEAWCALGENTRRCRMRRFPYGVFTRPLRVIC